MSLFEDASLITTPNAYKAGKLYSIKPTNGDGDLDVTRATTATRVNSAGLIESVANNVPRLDYTNGSCPSVLVEPQRTNLILRSEEFDNAVWIKSRVTITQNDIIAPNGTMTADKMTADINTLSYFIDFSTLTGTGTFTTSIFAKKGSVDWLYIRQGSSGGGTSLARAWFDLNNGVVGAASPSPISYKIEDYGNGWYRCSMTFEVLAGGIPRPQFYLSTGDEIASFTSDGTENLFLWGAQVEAGSNATSYIPTVASAVTRNADVIGKTGIASLIGQTEGTLFAEFNRKGESPANQLLFGISDGTVNNRLRILTWAGLDLRILFQLNGNITQYDVTTSGGIINSFEQQSKIAVAYKSGDIAVYINGVLFDSSSNTLTIANTLSEYNMSSTSAGSTISQALLFKTRLTNAQLEALTTL